MNEFTYFYFSIVAYLLYILLAVILKLPARENPNNALCKAHLGFGLLITTVAAIHGIITNWEFGPPINLAIAFMMYVFYHYAIALNFFLLATRSVSSNLMATLTEAEKPLNFDSLYRSYAGNRGFEFVRADRLKWMIHRQMIRENGSNLELTEGGMRSAWITKFILSIWGLVQIGSPSK